MPFVAPGSGSAAAVREVVGRVRLDCLQRLYDGLLGGGLLRAILEAQVGRQRDRQEDAEDQEHDHQLDEREALLGAPGGVGCVTRGCRSG